jgi:large repetitive protein
MPASWFRQLRAASTSRTAVARRTTALRRRFTLEPLEGRQMLSTLTVTTVADNGSNTEPTTGSLRAAIVQADAQPAGTLTTIDFKIGTGTQTIRLPVALPQITRTVVIDGTTQPGYSAQPLIDIDGGSLGWTGLGFIVTNTASGTAATPGALKGLEITDFSGGAVLIDASDFNLNHDDIGLVVTSQGTYVRSNGNYGALLGVGASDDSIMSSTIAGTTDGYGVAIAGPGTGNDTLTGDYIGTDPTGRLAVDSEGVSLGNSENGVEIVNDTTNNTISNSVISNNGQDGVLVTGAGTEFNVLTGNDIGSDATGTKDFPNANDGVVISDGASYNTVGGTTAAARNLISGNSVLGVEITDVGTSDNLLEGNYIGTTAAGTIALPNGINGVDIVSEATYNTVGGTTAGARNVVSGNSYNGIVLAYSGTSYNVVEGNYIGTDLTGANPLANCDDGVDLIGGASANTIGGRSAAALNVISGNDQNGVLITNSGTVDNQVEGNDIGTDDTGAKAVANGNDGVVVSDGASSNVVGGTTSGQRDVISGNTVVGVDITDADTYYNLVEGNYIGTSASGSAAVPNGINGVDILSGAQFNTVGGTSASARNVIPGNAYNGVVLGFGETSENMVEADYIGTDVTGAKALANGQDGVEILGAAGDNTIGGTTTGARDIISGNARYGVLLTDTATTDNQVDGDHIGTDLTGELPVSNVADGVAIQNGSSSNYVESDLISANGGIGVLITGSGTNSNVMIYDSIGLDATGLKPVDATGKSFSNTTGVVISGGSSNAVESSFISGNQVGISLQAGASNCMVIANDIGTGVDSKTNIGNTLDGVVLDGVSGSTIENNLIVYNGDVGILGEDGSTSQNNTLMENVFTITLNGVTYGNKNGATRFE